MSRRQRLRHQSTSREPITLDAGWLANLSEPDQIIARLALRTHERIKMVGGCYQLTFFLHRLLREQFGIETAPVVGWVNDNTDDLMISHAWLESHGRKTDISLTVTEHPNVQLQWSADHSRYGGRSGQSKL